MRIFEQGPDDEGSEEGASGVEGAGGVEGASGVEGSGGTVVRSREGGFALVDLQDVARGRSAGIWILTVVDLLLASLAAGAFFFLSGAENYLINESADFGSELNAALYGIWVLKIASCVLAGGFLICAAGVVSLTRLGWRLQWLWALLLCLTIVGLPYGVPTLVLLRRRTTRERFFGYS